MDSFREHFGQPKHIAFYRVKTSKLSLLKLQNESFIGYMVIAHMLSTHLKPFWPIKLTKMAVEAVSRLKFRVTHENAVTKIGNARVRDFYTQF